MDPILESLDSAGSGLRVEFVKQGDRFGHTIFAVHQGDSFPVLRSREGTDEDFSPPSPPYAQWHQQGDVLYLSGATTLGHWSLGLEIEQGRLRFEVACRFKQAIPDLGSRYLVVHPAYGLECGEGTESRQAEDRLQIGPEQQAAGPFPATLQWRYSLAPRR